MNNIPLNIKIKNKADSLKGFLAQNYPHLINKQASIENGSPESGYWHSGYYIALCDILRIMENELESAINADN